MCIEVLMKYYTIYETINKINGQNYIGKHITNNPYDDYLGSGKYLKRAIKKYGVENFEKKVLYIFDNKEDMDRKEAELVDEEYLKFCKTYNLKQGGDGGWDYINENGFAKNKEHGVIGGSIHKKRMKEDMVYRQKRIDTWIKMIKQRHKEGKIKYDTFTGKHHTDETKRKIGQKNSIHQQGEKNSQYGTCWIYNEKENIKISKKDIDIYLQQGWIKGRKLNL